MAYFSPLPTPHEQRVGETYLGEKKQLPREGANPDGAAGRSWYLELRVLSI